MTQAPLNSATVGNMKNLLLGIVGLLGIVSVTWAQDAKSLLQQGLFAEEAEGKLEKAAASYQQIIDDYDAARAFAVAAIYRLAEVRRKQEQNDQAAQLYQRILAEFADMLRSCRQEFGSCRGLLVSN
ncbi:MAG: tetratricopeptide repeat protein [Verrucomicrobiae bacterium]|nr:tetratricopeptide repeat protein [Verrucomicrobiae bacterium]